MTKKKMFIVYLYKNLIFFHLDSMSFSLRLFYLKKNFRTNNKNFFKIEYSSCEFLSGIILLCYAIFHFLLLENFFYSSVT